MEGMCGLELRKSSENDKAFVQQNAWFWRQAESLGEEGSLKDNSKDILWILISCLLFVFCGCFFFFFIL